MADVDDAIKNLITENKIVMYDNFQTSEQLGSSLTSTASCTKNINSILLETGVYSPSSALAYYKINAFNPLYSTLCFKARFNSIANVTAFIGFKETLADPEHDDTESHAGILIYNNKFYFSTGYTQGLVAKYRNTNIPDLDPARWLVYRIDAQLFKWYSVPVVTPYFDGFVTTDKGRAWSSSYSNSTCTPNNKVHWLVAYISNTTNANKTLEISKLFYQERQPD